MRIEFRQGVPEDCTAWLWDNVGPGNLTPVGESSSIHGYNHDRVDNDDYAWFYERVRMYPQPHDAFDPRDMGPRYVPTITVKDEKLAVLFILRWV